MSGKDRRIAGSIGAGAADEAMQRMVEQASKTAAPGIGFSWRTDEQTGGAVLVVVGQHPLAIAPVAVKIDPINALMIASIVASGVASSLSQGIAAPGAKES